MVGGADDGLVELVRRALRAGAVPVLEDVDERPIRQDGDLVPDRELVLVAGQDVARRLPGLAAVGRPREHDVAADRGGMLLRVDPGLVAREATPVPDRVDVVGVRRIGGDRLLVVEAWAFREQGDVAGDRRRLAPRVAAVGRLADEHRRDGQVGARREADLVDVAVRGERHPRVGRAAVVAAVRGGAAGAVAEVRPRLGPRRAAVVARGRDEAVRAAVVPAILLEDADDGARVRRIHGDERLDLAVRVVRPGAADRARGERAQAGGVDRA